MQPPISPTRYTLLTYWRHTARYKTKLLIIYPMMVIAQLIEDFASPLLISWVLTKIAANNLDAIRHANVGLICAAIVACEFMGNILWNILIRLFWRTQDAIMRDIIMTTFDHIQALSSRFFANRFAGSLVSQVNKFSYGYERFTDALTWNVFKLIVSIIATCIIIGTRAPIIVAALLIVTILYIPTIWYFRRRQLPYNQRWAAAESKRTGQLSDALSNIMAVKAFGNEKLESARMKAHADEVHDRSIDTMHLNMNQELISGKLQRSINIAVVISSIYLALSGKAGVGTIYLALTFTLGILRRLWDLNNTFRTFTRVFGDAHDMAEILQIKPAIKDLPGAKKLKSNKGKIEFSDVVFAHEDGRSNLFSNLSLSIRPSQKIGLVGHSGSGKTTITQLLLRFQDIQGGSIKIDDQNIASVTQESLRRSIAYVPQEPLLFHRTLAENIAYGKLNATQAEIERVAKLAHAHEFISELPEGYQTLVGERGVKLSGGQRQRVAIARAMLKDAPILLLDEATSALDSESEALIQDALWKLMQGRTAIVIAHRLSTIQKMDRIIVLDKGKIAEQGTHAELLKNKGVYAGLWTHQSGGFLEE